MTTVINGLETLGLSEQEQRIFEILLFGVPLSASQIAKEGNINRSAVYSHLEKLINKGLVIKNESKIIQFSPSSPKDIENIIKFKIEKLKELNQSIPQLLKESSRSNDDQDFTIYRGEKAVLLLGEMVAEAKGDVLYLGGLSGVEHITDEKWYYKYYAKKRRKNLNIDYMISDWTKSTVKYFFEESDMFTKRRFLPKEIKANGCIVIFQDRVVVVKYRPSFIAVLVKDQSLVQILKLAYGSFWKDLEGKNIPPKGTKS